MENETSFCILFMVQPWIDVNDEKRKTKELDLRSFKLLKPCRSMVPSFLLTQKEINKMVQNPSITNVYVWCGPLWGIHYMIFFEFFIHATYPLVF